MTNANNTNKLFMNTTNTTIPSAAVGCPASTKMPNGTKWWT